MKKLYLHGEVNIDAYARISSELDYIEDNGKHKGNHKITLEITSEGGFDIDSTALYDKIRNSTCQITTLGVGYVQSAAVLVFVAGVRRLCTPHTVFMVHEDAIKIEDSIRASRAYLKAADDAEDSWAIIMEERTGTSKDIWMAMSAETSFINAQDALTLGLVHGIVYPKEG